MQLKDVKILTIDTNSTCDFEEDHENWSPELRRAFDEADIVLGLFSPHSHIILKGDAEVMDARKRYGYNGRRWAMLEGSADPEFCAQQNSKLRTQS